MMVHREEMTDKMGFAMSLPVYHAGLYETIVICNDSSLPRTDAIYLNPFRQLGEG